MNSENEFKNKLSEKLSHKEFQFDEANWEEARKLIDASREGKKRRVLPFFLVGLLFIGAGSLGFYFLNSSSLTNKNYTAKASATHKLIAANNTAVEKPATLSPVKENTEIKKTVSAENKTQANNQVKDDIKNNSTNAESKARVKNIERKKQIASKSNYRTKQNTVEVKKQTTKQNTFVPGIVKEENKKQEPEKITEAKTTSTDKEDVAATENKEVKDIIENKENKAGTVQNNNSELPVTTNTIVSLPVADAKPLATAASDTVKENITRPPTHFISFEAGTNYLFGWKNPGKRDANGFNPVVGLNYSNLVSKKLALSFGIQYTMVRNLSYSNIVVKTTHYNFGEESNVMVFTPTTLHYLVAPLRLSYAVNQKNSFGLGCNVGYLFNVSSNVELYTEQGNQKSASTNLKSLGYTQGFKTVNTQLSLFYRRSLAKDLWLHAEFMYGLADVKDNTFFNSTVHERNTGLKITLIYNLFKK